MRSVATQLARHWTQQTWRAPRKRSRPQSTGRPGAARPKTIVSDLSRSLHAPFSRSTRVTRQEKARREAHCVGTLPSVGLCGNCPPWRDCHVARRRMRLSAPPGFWVSDSEWTQQPRVPQERRAEPARNGDASVTRLGVGCWNNITGVCCQSEPRIKTA